MEIERLGAGTSGRDVRVADVSVLSASPRHYDAPGYPYEVYDAQNDPVQRAAMFAYTGGDPTMPAIVVDGDYVQSGWGSPLRG